MNKDSTLIKLGAVCSILVFLALFSYAFYAFRANIPYSPFCHMEENVSMVYMPGFDLIDRPSLMAYEWDGVKPTWLCENGVEVIDLTFVMGTHGYVDFLGKKQTCMLNMPKKVC